MDVMVGEDFHEFFANRYSGPCFINMERVETAAGSDSETCKLNQQVSVRIRCQL